MKNRLTLIVVYTEEITALVPIKENNSIKSQLLTKFIFLQINTTKSKNMLFIIKNACT